MNSSSEIVAEKFFRDFRTFVRDVDQGCKDLKTNIERPALPVNDGGYPYKLLQ